MTRYRWLVLAVLILALALPALPASAQEEPKEAVPPSEPPAAPAATEKPAETEKKKEGPGFWGDRLALYLAAGGGVGSAEPLDTSIKTSSDQSARGTLDMDLFVADVAIGWKLPKERGSFRIEFTGFAEDQSSFQGYGDKSAVVTSGTGSPDQHLQWWDVRVEDGTLTSILNPPQWVDANADGEVDSSEITYSTNPATQTAPAPEDFENRLQTYDFLFYRKFGGRVWSAEYSAGLRYLLYEGNLPAAAWLSVSSGTPEAGFTDGITLPLLYLREKTSGFGPTGSLELDWNLFKQRLVFFGLARFAFLFEDLEVDSGEFSTLVGTQTNVFLAPARIQHSTSHGAWNIGARLGARFRIVDGFRVEAFVERTAYHDVAIVPNEIQVPNRPQQIPRGTSSLYTTQDLEIDSARLVLSFQF